MTFFVVRVCICSLHAQTQPCRPFPSTTLQWGFRLPTWLSREPTCSSEHHLPVSFFFLSVALSSQRRHDRLPLDLKPAPPVLPPPLKSCSPLLSFHRSVPELFVLMSSDPSVSCTEALYTTLTRTGTQVTGSVQYNGVAAVKKVCAYLSTDPGMVASLVSPIYFYGWFIFSPCHVFVLTPCSTVPFSYSSTRCSKIHGDYSLRRRATSSDADLAHRRVCVLLCFAVLSIEASTGVSRA